MKINFTELSFSNAMNDRFDEFYMPIAKDESRSYLGRIAILTFTGTLFLIPYTITTFAETMFKSFGSFIRDRLEISPLTERDLSWILLKNGVYKTADSLFRTIALPYTIYCIHCDTLKPTTITIWSAQEENYDKLQS